MNKLKSIFQVIYASSIKLLQAVLKRDQELLGFLRRCEDVENQIKIVQNIRDCALWDYQSVSAAIDDSNLEDVFALLSL